MAKETATIEVSADHGSHGGINLVDPNVGMMIITWVSFFIVFGILYKFAWKPILSALDQREATLKKSLEDAERLSAEMEQLEQTREKLLNEAHEKSKEIVNESRQAANEAAKHIQEKAREESQILLENAKREIKNETEKAQAILREESADLAIELASKVIEENLDNKKNKRLINKFIKDN